MKKLIAVLALTFPLLAATNVFSKYEAARQAFLKGSLADVQKNAAALAADAREAKNDAVATLADAVAKSADLDAARTAFGKLSEELIKARDTAGAAKPAVYHCPMVQKSWLQPKGQVGNPYDASMPTCGVLKAE